MHVEQIYTGCLAQGAYYIRSGSEAAIIDPLREPGPYLERLRRDGVTLRYVFETHFHADFVSGHLDLARATGAEIVFGPGAECGFDARIARDGEEFAIGGLRIRTLHTPGHTLESTTWLLLDESGKEHAIFSGDTLFLGDVGRPDLAQKSSALTQDDLAGMLYDSLHAKIMPLPDEVIVYPAHGAGSACGKNMSRDTVDTLGNQKKTNYALLQPDKASFIREVTDGLLPPPGYFGANVRLNKNGCEPYARVVEDGNKALSLSDWRACVESGGALILDVRPPGAFAAGFVPGSVSIGLKGDFAPWAGTILADVSQPLVLICPPGDETEALTRLARVGFDRVLGFLEGGFETWVRAGLETDRVDRITATEMAEGWQQAPVVDVRKPSEFESGHVKDALSFPLADITSWASRMPRTGFFYLHCAGGYRSMIAASVLKRRGIHNFREIDGGYNAISATSVPRLQAEASGA